MDGSPKPVGARPYDRARAARSPDRMVNANGELTGFYRALGLPFSFLGARAMSLARTEFMKSVWGTRAEQRILRFVSNIPFGSQCRTCTTACSTCARNAKGAGSVRDYILPDTKAGRYLFMFGPAPAPKAPPAGLPRVYRTKERCWKPFSLSKTTEIFSNWCRSFLRRPASKCCRPVLPSRQSAWKLSSQEPSICCLPTS